MQDVRPLPLSDARTEQNRTEQNRTRIDAIHNRVLCQKVPPLFRVDSSNVDVALMCFGQAETRLIRSSFNYLISFSNLVAGTGFEPVTFRL